MAWGASFVGVLFFAVMMSLDAKWLEALCLDEQNIVLQAKVDACNNIQSSLPYEIFRKGPPVVREMLDLRADADNMDIITIVLNRSRGALTARQEALSVLDLPWYTPNSVLQKRLKLSTLLSQR